jgi:hypothetical protein
LKRKPLIYCELHSVESARGVERILNSSGYRIATLDGRPFQVPETVVQGELQILAFPDEVQLEQRRQYCAQAGAL